MRKVTLVLFIGAICGGGITYALLDAVSEDAADGTPNSFLDGIAGFTANRGVAPDARQATVSMRLAAYRSAAAHDEASSLEAALMRAAAESAPARDLEIDALLARLGELDPARAARVARTLELDTRFVAEAWLTWAERDREAALAALRMLEEPGTRRAVAVVLLDVFGDSLPAIERVAAALPDADRGSFEVDALAYKAERDPYGAFRDALAVGDAGVQHRAVQAVAAVWARVDPEEAFAQSELAPVAMQQALKQSISMEWARLDPGGFTRVLSSGVDVNDIAGGIQLVLASDPEGVLRATESMDSPLALSLRAAAVGALAQVDLNAAKTRVEAMPPGQDRERALQQVASAYARQDPEAALAWAEELSASPANIQRSIMVGIAASGDIERALAMIDTGAVGIESDLMMSLVASQAAQDPREARDLADKLAAKTDAQSKNMLSRVVSAWAQRDPDTALDWVLANGTAADAAVLGNMARTLASRDAVSAAATTSRLPPALRAAWIAQIAGPYARNDAQGALRWLEQYRGQEGYDVGLRQIVGQAAQTDPRAAASMLERASPEVQLGAAQAVAMSWARNEPEAATRWAMSLSDARARASAIGAAAAAWSATDVTAAENWALTLAAGSARDEALTALLPRRAFQGEDIDGRVLASFSTAEARQSAVARVIPMLATRNPPEARRLLDAYVLDPIQRRELEEQIAQAGAPNAPSSAVVDASGNVIFLSR